MAIKFDPKKFQYKSSDKDRTVLQHKDGHTLTIAHNKLSDEMKKQLSALGASAKNAQTPAEADELKHKMAEGGEVCAEHQEKDCMACGGRVEMAQGGNAGEKRKEIFGKQSSPSNPEMREKHIEHIREFAKKLLAITLMPSGGKINPKTGERRDENPEEGVDKPDWRSGKLESQWNPDAMIHELAHLLLMPKHIGLAKAQEYMDKQYAEVQKKYGYMKQKRSQGEIQPMAAEQVIRRHLGLPPALQSVPVKEGEGPRLAVDTGTPAGIRVQKGNKQVDLIRQSRLLSPENRQLLEDRLAGKEKFHPERGWEINPDTLGAKTEMYKQMVASNEIPEETTDEELQPKRIAAAEGADLLQDDQSPAQDEQAAGQAIPPMLQRVEPTTNIPGVSDVVSAAMPTKEQFEQNAQDYQQKFNAFKAQHEQAGTTSTIGGSAATRAQMDMDDYRALKAAELANPNSLSAMENRRLAQLKQIAEPQQPVQPDTRGLATQPEDSGASLITPTSASLITPTGQPQAEDSGLTTITSGVSAPTDESAPVPVSTQPKIKEVTPEDVKKHVYDREREDMSQELANYEKDLLLGHIEPKTYQSLFANKTTLGKIGTIFGLMLSGFGSGLSGQKNMVLEMMNSEIEKDLDAQKESAKNVQNFFRLSNDAILQKAQAESQIAQAGSQIAQAAGIRQDTKLKAYSLSKMMANATALHYLVKKVESMPEGPQKENAKAQLAWLNGQVQNDNYNLMDRAATSAAYINMMSAQGGGEGKAQQLNMLDIVAPERAKQLRGRYVPDLDQYANRDITTNEINQLGAYKQFLKQLSEARNFTKGRPYASLNPIARKEANTLMANLGNTLRQAEEMGVIKQAEIGFMKDLVGKSPADFFAFLNSAPQLKQLEHLKTEEYHQALRNLGLTPNAAPSADIRIGPDGRKYMRGPDGKTAIPVK